MPDPTHVYKNVRTMLENNKEITIPQFLVEKHKLPSNKVKLEHFEKLLDIEHELGDLRMVPGLHDSYLHPNNWDKMRVNVSYNVLHNDAGAGLNTVAEFENNEEFVTTGWFVKYMYKWFKFVSARDTSHAFGKKNPEKFEEAIKFFKDFIEIFESISIGKDGHWKPVQTGAILSTTTLLYLIDYFVNERNYDFFLCGHLTQCCLENLFSVVRSRHPCPNVLQFKQDLKMLSVSQFIKPVTNSSYLDTETPLLLDLISAHKRNKKKKEEENDDCEPLYNIDIKSIKFSIYKINVIHHISGSIINGIIKKTEKNTSMIIEGYEETCTNCWMQILSTTKVFDNYAKLTREKEFDEDGNSLLYLTKKGIDFFTVLEKIFSECKKELKNKNALAFLINTALVNEDIQEYNFTNCHDIKNILIKRYITFRLHSLNKAQNNFALLSKQVKVPKSNPSRTMAMYCYTRQPGNTAK